MPWPWLPPILSTVRQQRGFYAPPADFLDRGALAQPNSAPEVARDTEAGLTQGQAKKRSPQRNGTEYTGTDEVAAEEKKRSPQRNGTEYTGTDEVDTEDKKRSPQRNGTEYTGTDEVDTEEKKRSPQRNGTEYTGTDEVDTEE